jgi:hypothetical protein
MPIYPSCTDFEKVSPYSGVNIEKAEGFVDEDGNAFGVCKQPEGAPSEYGLYKVETMLNEEDLYELSRSILMDVTIGSSALSLPYIVALFMDDDPPGGVGGNSGSGKEWTPEEIDWTADIWTKCAGDFENSATLTTESKILLGTAIGIGVLVTAPVTLPMLIGGATVYGGAAAAFGLADMDVIHSQGRGPAEA